jgi:hypothetical protein
MEPVWTARGKLMPLHLVKQRTLEGEAGVETGMATNGDAEEGATAAERVREDGS